MPIDWSTLSIMGTIAGVSFGGAIWLTGKFDEVKDTFRELLAKHEELDNERFNAIGFRLLKVEIELDKDGRNIASPERSRYEI